MTTITRRLGTTLLPGQTWPPTRPLAPARTGAGAVQARRASSHPRCDPYRARPGCSRPASSARGPGRGSGRRPTPRPKPRETPRRTPPAAAGSIWQPSGLFGDTGSPPARDRVCAQRLRRAGALRWPVAPACSAPWGRRRSKEDVHARIHGTRHGEEWVTSKNGSRPCSSEFPMALRLHLPHRTTAGSAPSQEPPHLGARVYAVQRAGAVLVALFLLVFALLGFASGQKFFSIQGQPVLGMSSNGLLSTISVVVALVLLAAAARGPRIASTVMIVLGPLFLLSAFVNAIVLSTRLNWLAFSISNVVFSIVVGLLLLLLGAYGRIGGHLPPDSPYAHTATDEASYVDERPSTPEEVAAEKAMREAEIAVVQHTATADQQRRVQAMAQMHTRADRRRLWMEFDAADENRAAQDAASPDRGVPVPRQRVGRRHSWHQAGPRSS